MLTLVVTALATAYFIVPELLNRLVLSIFIIRKSVSAPKSEEITRASFWALVPLAISWCIRNWGYCKVPAGTRAAAKVVFAGLYSESLFKTDPGNFFHSVTIVARANAYLLGRAYLIVIAGTVIIGLFARRLGRWRAAMSGTPRLVNFLLFLFLPRISEWHLALSPMLVKDTKRFTVEIDVMTKSGKLYQGTVEEKVIGATGELQTLLLGSPRRYLHDAFTRDMNVHIDNPDAVAKPLSQTYWRPIPGRVFLLVGGDVSSVNVRHVYRTLASVEPQKDPALNRSLVQLNERLNKMVTVVIAGSSGD